MLLDLRTQTAVNMFETPHSRWRALETRNPLAASAFLYGVKTTHIYCRPTCPSRLARKANVVFFDSTTEAEAAGFRACKRCKPSQTDFEHQARHKKAVREACELIDAAGGALTLETLAGSVGLSPRYFHGVFKGVMGVTPSAYAIRVRKKNSHSKPEALPRQESDKSCVSDEGLSPSSKEDEGTAVPCESSLDLCFIDPPPNEILHAVEGVDYGPPLLGTPGCRDVGSCTQCTTLLTGNGAFDGVPFDPHNDYGAASLWGLADLDYGGVVTQYRRGDIPTADLLGPQDEVSDFLLTDLPNNFSCHFHNFLLDYN
ncbi:metal binding domain of Ada-domain-containing protein [Chaetomium sp. MPI-CAGE-AT-0009]|nr:metal binding domain of Ada-domain-containing protein [Chaetomium sp. MPI-CAGE-AT-0009]